MRAFFKDDDAQFGLELALGAAYRQATDIGEVLAAADRIVDGDADSWVSEWFSLAERSYATGQQAEQAGARASALSAYRRASTYWSTGLYLVDRSSSADSQIDQWRRQFTAWERSVDLSPIPGERVTIDCGGSKLPAWFFRAPNSRPGEKRPLIVMNNGSDGPTSAMWIQGGAAAAERGWHWLTFDGPGQQSSLFEKGIRFRPDWEAVLTPVFDCVNAREDVDSDRVAVIGVSQAGFWVPRAISFEHRFRAAVVDPGVVDVSTSWFDQIPSELRELFEAGEKEQFDTYMNQGAKEEPERMAVLEFRARPYRMSTDSKYDLYAEVMKYRLGEEVEQIETPVLITDPENEQFWPGQSPKLYDMLPGDRTLVPFTEQEGADRHCEPLGSALRDQRIFDWLDAQLT